MGKGRKAKNTLPDCAFLFIPFYYIALDNNSLVVELSDDSKKVRCNVCVAAVHGQNGGWIQKESLACHLKSEIHARSVSVHQNREAIRTAGEQAMQEESAIEERMDLVMLSSTIKPVVTAAAHVPRLSVEEQEMWASHAFSDEVFDAGIDPAVAAVEERKRLEREATNFDLCRGADFLPEEDPNDSELLLDELEQEDILTELLWNAGMYIFVITCVHAFQHISCFRIDMNMPDGADLLDKEVKGHGSQSKISDAWSRYESKMVGQPFNAPTSDYYIHFSFHIDVPPRHP